MYNSASHEENTNLPAFNLEWINVKFAYLGVFSCLLVEEDALRTKKTPI